MTMVKPDLAAEITDVRAIIAFRNQLTHAYSAVDHATIGGFCKGASPAEVTRLLATLASD